jgi:toxin ParE1/3/4
MNSSKSSKLSMAYRVEITARAERDLDALYLQMCTTGSEHARVWYFGLRTAISGLHEMPSRCPKTPEKKNLRHLLYGRKARVYRVIFRVRTKTESVEILHIRHGARRKFRAADLE